MNTSELPVLVVDLDNTLLKSDLLFESFWSAFGSDWKVLFGAIAYLCMGKSKLKNYLAKKSRIDVTTLPYNLDVVSYVEAHRQAGGRTALVTASDYSLAHSIAAHLCIFDEVHGSDGNHNLKGVAKAEFLVGHFGETKFDYMGDARADLHVWKYAQKAITVNVATSVLKKLEEMGKPCESFVSDRSSVSYVRALRPHQWLKNIIIFLPMISGHQLNFGTFNRSLTAFIAFSLVASSVYILNDLLDLNSDRTHPRKRFRSFASGDIPIVSGCWMALFLLCAGFITAAALGTAFLIVMLAYYALTTAYSLNLKKRVVMDICVLSSLYTIRILAGGIAGSISLSEWLLAFSIFFFFSLATIKRQAELVDMVKRGALLATGRGYTIDDLPIICTIAISTGYVSVLVMALYVNSPSVATLYANTTALWVICFILLYWITRIAFITHRGLMLDDPVIFAAKDRVSQICFLAILACLVLGTLS